MRAGRYVEDYVMNSSRLQCREEKREGERERERERERGKRGRARVKRTK